MYDAIYKHRKQLDGTFHTSLFGTINDVEVLNYNQLGDIDIDCSLSDNKETVVKVRKAPCNLIDNILVLHKRLSTINGGNCRGNKNTDEDYSLSKDNKDIREMMSAIGKERNKWLKNIFTKDYLKKRI